MKQYSEEFDAYYDDVTMEWLESKCDDPDCVYCPVRPDKAPYPMIVEILPTAYWVESDFFGGKHIMIQHDGMNPFCYCSFYYDYAYTSNSIIHAMAVKMMENFGIKEADIVWKQREFPSVS